MALHGFVWVNAEVIGHYEIVRLGPVPAHQISTYRWFVHFPDLWEEAVQGEIEHHFSAAAPALIAAVLAAADGQARRIEGRPRIPGATG
jgi:hypothetical protein